MTFRTSRRTFLSGSAATVASAGLWNMLRGQALASQTGAKRVVFWYVCEGTVGQAFWPGGGPGPFSINENATMGNNPQSRGASINNYRSDAHGTWILAPMKRHEQDMTLVSGLHTDLMNSGGDHARACDSMLTGGAPGQGSIDQFLGDHLQETAPFHAIYSSMFGEHVKENIANFVGILFTGSGNVIAPTWNPVTTYNQVFPTGLNPDTGDPTANHALESRLSVLGSVRQQLESIGNRGGAEARSKLEAYLESIERVEAQTQGLLDVDGVPNVEVDIPPEWLNINPQDKYWRRNENFAALGKIMMDTTIASLALDRTRVATMHWSASGDSKGPMDGKHYLSLGLDLEGTDVQDHALGHENVDRNRRNQCRIFRWYYEQLAYFVDRLKAIPEGDGTLFDNTVIVVCSEFGGYNHNFNDAPFMLVGSGGGAFRTGRYLDVHNGSFRSYGDALLGVAHGLGLQLDRLGNANAPMTELLV